jgi:outer membrane protein assembly factor BamB
MKCIRILVLILCACFVSAAWSQQPGSKCINDWSGFHRTNMRRWNPCEKVLNVHNVGNLTSKWSFGTFDRVVSSPAVANGVVYVGSNDGNLSALDLTTGAVMWNYSAGSVVSSPAVAYGVVYYGASDNSVHALNAQTGASVWSHKTGGYVSGSPAVANGVVYVGSYDQNIYALNAKTGAKLWSYTTGNQVESSPVVTNGMVYVGSDDHTVYAFGLN